MLPYILIFLLGLVIGGGVGTFVMAAVALAADDRGA